MKKITLAVLGTILFGCGAAIACDDDDTGSVGLDPNADYFVPSKQMARIYREAEKVMADLTAQRRTVYLRIMDDGAELPDAGSASQVALLEETINGTILLRLFLVDETGTIYEAKWEVFEDSDGDGKEEQPVTP